MDRDRIALLVMDVQPNIVSRLSDQAEYLTSVKQAVLTAHKAHIRVIFVVVGFRPGFPEVSTSNKSFAAIKSTGAAGMVDPRPAIEVGEDDIVVTKRRVSAFTGSDLEVVLLGQGIGHLVLSGIATSGVVLSTLREAADRDYGLTVLSDLCADFDDEVHRVLLDKVFKRQADVITFATWEQAINKADKK